MKITMDSLVAFPLEEAEKCISYYVNNARDKGIPEDKIIRCFTVKSEDVIAALEMKITQNEMKYHSFRAYIGLQTNELVTDLYKLFLVPIDIYGNDVIKKGKVDGYPDEISYVYDFNTPCPNTCNVSSPLYTAPGVRTQP